MTCPCDVERPRRDASWHCVGGFSNPDPGVVAKLGRAQPGAWSIAQIEFKVVPTAGSGVEMATLLRVAQRSAHAWNSHAPSRGVPMIRVTGAEEDLLEDDAEAVQDGENQVIVRTRNVEACYDAARQATTHLYRGLSNGDLVEADIEINGVDPRWLQPGGGVNVDRLHALLAHEWGHVLGLDHSCGLLRTRGIVGAGAGVACDDQRALKSIMFPDPFTPARALVLEPTPDDLAALHALYPTLPAVSSTSATVVIALLVGACFLGGWLVRWRRP